jgi:NADH-quinone oxidoreductase subunit M
VALIGLVSVLYGALVAMAQRDLKRMIAYTSINHMGYVVVGVAAAAAATSGDAARLALDGSVLQMVAHGLVTGLLFFVAGFIHARTGTRDLDQLAGLIRPLPVYSSIVAVGFFASLGLPGLAQFPAELQIFLGTFDVWPAVGAAIVVGIVITAALFLRAFGGSWLGPTPERWSALPDLGRRELWVAAPLVALIVAVGVYPTPLLELIERTSLVLVLR